MKALILLNLEDCTFDEIDEAEIKEISLVYQDKETGNRYEFEWETGFKIMPMPSKMKVDYDAIATCEVTEKVVAMGWNACIETILGEQE